MSQLITCFVVMTDQKFFFSYKTALLAENGKLKNLDVIVKKFMQLTTAHRGDVKVLVTTVMVS